MTCGLGVPCARNVQSAYNNVSQTFTSAGGTVNILGTQVCDYGCAVDTGVSGFTVRSEGVYRFAYDVTFAATGTGNGTVQLYNGSEPMPCAVATFVGADGAVVDLHVESVLPVRACYGVRPVISCMVSGVAGSVTHVCASAVKL